MEPMFSLRFFFCCSYISCFGWVGNHEFKSLSTPIFWAWDMTWNVIALLGYHTLISTDWRTVYLGVFRKEPVEWQSQLCKSALQGPGVSRGSPSHDRQYKLCHVNAFKVLFRLHALAFYRSEQGTTSRLTMQAFTHHRPAATSCATEYIV